MVSYLGPRDLVCLSMLHCTLCLAIDRVCTYAPHHPVRVSQDKHAQQCCTGNPTPVLFSTSPPSFLTVQLPQHSTAQHLTSPHIIVSIFRSWLPIKAAEPAAMIGCSVRNQRIKPYKVYKVYSCGEGAKHYCTTYSSSGPSGGTCAALLR